jgi:hypothetical protein
MAETPKPPSAVSFWIVIIAVLAVIVAALWNTIVNVVIPLITAVKDTYF